MGDEKLGIKICFECGDMGNIHDHHIVPRSRGGTKTVPLCEGCHAKAHHRDKRMTTSALTSAALQAKKRRGEKVGRAPLGMKIENKELVPGDDFYLVVQILFARFKLKMTYQAIADLMTEQSGRNFHLPLVWNTCKRWGSQPGWYKGIESIEEIQPATLTTDLIVKSLSVQELSQNKGEDIKE